MGTRGLPSSLRRRWESWRDRPNRVSYGLLRRLTPDQRSLGTRPWLAVDRHYIEGFLGRHAGDIRGRVLEIGDAAYTRRFGTAVERATCSTSPGNPQATIVADLARPDDLPERAFDCAIVTQTLHLIYDVPAALATLRRALIPGGVLLRPSPGSRASAPRMTGAPTWNWTFTSVSARRLLGAAFGEANSHPSRTHGNVLAAISFLQGLAAGELERAELAYRDPAYEVMSRSGPPRGSGFCSVAPPRGAPAPRHLPGRLILLLPPDRRPRGRPLGPRRLPGLFRGHLDSSASASARLAPGASSRARDRSPSSPAPRHHVRRRLCRQPPRGRAAARAVRASGNGIRGHRGASSRLRSSGGTSWSESSWLPRRFRRRWRSRSPGASSRGSSDRRHGTRAAGMARNPGGAPQTRLRPAVTPLYLDLWKLLRPLPDLDREPRVLAELRGLGQTNRLEPRPTHRTLSTGEACELARREVVELGAHTVTHPGPRLASTVDEQRAEIGRQQAARSRKLTGRGGDAAVLSIRWPRRLLARDGLGRPGVRLRALAPTSPPASTIDPIRSNCLGSTSVTAIRRPSKGDLSVARHRVSARLASRWC